MCEACGCWGCAKVMVIDWLRIRQRRFVHRIDGSGSDGSGFQGLVRVLSSLLEFVSGLGFEFVFDLMSPIEIGFGFRSRIEVVCGFGIQVCHIYYYWI